MLLHCLPVSTCRLRCGGDLSRHTNGTAIYVTGTIVWLKSPPHRERHVLTGCQYQ